MTAHLQFRAIGMILILALQINLFAQTEEPTGLLGDNFSLESALEEFKKAKSLEDFEKALNDEDKHVHNLDLNRDKEIDYLRVNDHMDNDVHAIVISAAVGKDESQDIAVIEIEKDGDKSATLQIVGDVDLYGEDMIVEPFEVKGDSKGRGPEVSMEYTNIVVNVWGWPSVSYVYGSSYVAYHSPFYWSSYPRRWKPWKPLGWTVWRPFRVRYTPRYRVTPVRRVTHAHVVYRPHRTASRTETVQHKTSIAKARTHNVHSKKTTTTKVAGVKTENGKAIAASKSKTTTKANGVKKTKTKTGVKTTNGKKTVKASKKTKTTKTKKGKKTKTKKAKKGKKKKG
jgi:hypothetical protein